MNKNKDLLQNWLNYKAIDKNTLTYLNTENINKPIIDDLYFDELSQKYFDLMPLCNINNKTAQLRFSDSATTFISRLFEEYVDSETLVVSSYIEHPSVNINLDLCDNVFLYQEQDLKNKNAKVAFPEIIKYKKIFVYIIGTHARTSYSTPQDFFHEIRDFCNKNGIKCTIVIDNVQEMFLLPRDYSIFDYIIGTAHAIVRKFNMGILITIGNNKVFGDKIYNWGMTYYDMLTKILDRKDKLFMFRRMLNDYYGTFMRKEGFKTDDEQNCAPYFFHITDIEGKLSPDIRKMLKECEIEFDDNRVIRFRAPTFLQRPDLFEKGIKLLDLVLEETEEE